MLLIVMIYWARVDNLNNDDSDDAITGMQWEHSATGKVIFERSYVGELLPS